MYSIRCGKRTTIRKVPVARCMYSQVSHPRQQGQVVITCVEDPYSDVAYGQLFGKLKAQACLFEAETLKSEWNSEN